MQSCIICSNPEFMCMALIFALGFSVFCFDGVTARELHVTYALAAGNELPEDRISVSSEARTAIVL